MNTEFRLDRTSFQAMTLEEADKTMSDYSHLSWQERLAVANYLNSVAYNFPINNPPALDRTICTPFRPGLCSYELGQKSIKF